MRFGDHEVDPDRILFVSIVRAGWCELAVPGNREETETTNSHEITRTVQNEGTYKHTDHRDITRGTKRTEVTSYYWYVRHKKRAFSREG